jgi:cytochrome P450
MEFRLSDFIPPFPPRAPDALPIWRRLWLARRDLLAMWEEPAFEWEFVSDRLFRRRIFVCNSPDSVQFAFNTKNASFERKSPEMRNALKPLIGDGLFISDGPVWRRRRRMMGPIVHVSRLPKFAPVMVEAAVDLRDRFAQMEQPAEIDALREMAQLTAEIICRTLFGRELGRSYSHEVVAGFTEYQHAVNAVGLQSLLGLSFALPMWLQPATGRAVARIIGVLDRILDDHRAGRRDGPSVIGQLFDARDEETGQPLDREAIRNEAAVLFMAGYETTANTLAWTWYLLSQAAEVESRLHQEVDAVLGTGGVHLMPGEMFMEALADRSGSKVRIVPAGVRQKYVFALVRDAFLHPRESMRSLRYLASTDFKEVVAVLDDLLPAVYQVLSCPTMLKLAAADRPGRKNTALMAAYFDDVCWDGEPIESAAVVPAMESVPA